MQINHGIVSSLAPISLIDKRINQGKTSHLNPVKKKERIIKLQYILDLSTIHSRVNRIH